jgi:4-amino-4-deoxy-L-arabinose transferase-like glycosyltransferase
MSPRTQMYRDLLLLTGAALVFFFPFLGGVHLFDWDEINFAECAREMVETGNYLQVQLNYFPFWEKPPLFFWLQALSMHLWGVGEYAARFPNAVAGLVTLLLLYGAGKLLFDRTYGLLWAFLYLGSTLPHLYFKSGIIDPWFNLFMAAGLFVFVLGYWQFREWEDRPGKGKAIWYFLGAGGLIGLAMLTKGPVGLLIPGLTMIVYWVYARLRWYVLPHHFMLVILGSLVVAGTWFGLEILANGPWFMEQFVEYQIRLLRTEDAGHGGFPGYHVVVLLLGCFPASVFALPAFFGLKPKRALHRDFHRWMIFLFWVVLILFSLVQSKIIHYSSMAYFPLTYLGALCVVPTAKEKAYSTHLVVAHLAGTGHLNWSPSDSTGNCGPTGRKLDSAPGQKGSVRLRESRGGGLLVGLGVYAGIILYRTYGGVLYIIPQTIRPPTSYALLGGNGSFRQPRAHHLHQTGGRVFATRSAGILLGEGRGRSLFAHGGL